MSELKKLLGKRIKEIRIQKNLTQEQLSELTNIGASRRSKIESGIYHPADDNLEKIAQALDIEPYKLYMCGHFKNISQLKKELQEKIDNMDEQQLRLISKIVNCIFE